MAQAPKWRDKGLELIVFFESTAAKLNDYVGKQKPPFPLIADPEHRVYDLYDANRRSILGLLRIIPRAPFRGAEAKKLALPIGAADVSPTMMPSDFLIDENRVIAVAHYGRTPDDRLALEDITAFADRM
jgi:peroxiredoxin